MSEHFHFLFIISASAVIMHVCREENAIITASSGKQMFQASRKLVVYNNKIKYWLFELPQGDFNTFDLFKCLKKLLWVWMTVKTRTKYKECTVRQFLTTTNFWPASLLQIFSLIVNSKKKCLEQEYALQSKISYFRIRL